MGNKRKYDSEEEILRKIKKLEKKLCKKVRRRINELSDDDTANNGLHEESEANNEEDTPPESIFLPESPGQASPHPDPASPSPASQEEPCLVPESQPETRAPTPTNHQDVTNPIESECPREIELDEEILQLLGDAPKTENPLGPPIHKDIANRWQEILAKGLLKEVKDQVMQQYLVPSNCELLTAPTLNPEVKAAIRDVMLKRDSSLMYQQKQLGVALSALGTAMNSILSNEESKNKILKPISDACRILCDIHYNETKTRRHFVLTSINSELKDSLVNTVRDNQLFGDNITEKIKTAKTIQKSGEALKNVQKTAFHKPNFVNKPNNIRNRLNFKPQHRKTDKPTTDAARGRSTQRPPRPGPSGASYKPPHRPRSPPKRNQRS